MLFFYLIEESRNVRESYLETLNLFLSHEPIENYLMKIEAKSKAAQKSISTAASSIAKSLKATFFLVFLEIMLTQNGDQSRILRNTQRLFEFVDEMGIDRSYIRIMVDMYLVPNTINMNFVDFDTFEASVLTLETLIKSNKGFVSPVLIDLITKILMNHFAQVLSSDSIGMDTEHYIGLILGMFKVIFSRNIILLLRHKNFIMDNFRKVMSRRDLNDRKHQIIQFLSESISSSRKLHKNLKDSFLTTSEILEEATKHNTGDTEVRRGTSAKHRSRSVAAQSRGALERQELITEFSRLQVFNNSLFSLIIDSIISGKAGSDHIENTLISCLEEMGSLDLVSAVRHYCRTQDPIKIESTFKQIFECLMKEKNQMSYCEMVLSNTGISGTGKEFFFGRLFGSLDMKSLATDKICAVSRVLFSVRNDLGSIKIPTIEMFYNVSLRSLQSDKKKVASNGIRMIGLLFGHLEEQVLFHLLESNTGFGTKQTGMQYIEEQFLNYLSHSFAKFAWNTTCSLSTIIQKFKVFVKEDEVSKGTKSSDEMKDMGRMIRSMCDKMMGIVLKNFIESQNVKLKLHSLSIFQLPGVLARFEAEETLNMIRFIVDLNSGSWAQSASPEYSDLKFLVELKARSVDLSIDLVRMFDERDYGSDHFAPMMSMFDSVVGRLRDQLVLSGVELETEDENTGKLLQKNVLEFKANSSILKVLDCIGRMKKKLQKYDDLCLSLLKYEKMNKLVDYQMKDGAIVIDNVFVELRVLNDV